MKRINNKPLLQTQRMNQLHQQSLRKYQRSPSFHQTSNFQNNQINMQNKTKNDLLYVQQYKENFNNNTNHTSHQSPIKNKCFNHPFRIAKYSSNNNIDQVLYFCQNCAIMVATKGFQVIKIAQASNNKPSQQKKYQIFYLKQLKDILQFTQQRHKFAISTIQNAELQLIRQISQINLYFTALHTQIDSKKNSFIDNIYKQKKQISNIKQQIDSFFLKLISKTHGFNHIPECLKEAEENLLQLRKIKKVSAQIITQKINIKSYEFNDVCQVSSQLAKFILDPITQKNIKINENSSQIQNYMEMVNSSIENACRSISESNSFTLDNLGLIEASMSAQDQEE